MVPPQVTYNQHTLYAKAGSYGDGTTHTANNDDNDISWVILGPVIGVGAVLVVGTIIVIMLCCCYCNHRDDVAKRKTSSAHDIIMVRYVGAPNGSQLSLGGGCLLCLFYI